MVTNALLNSGAMGNFIHEDFVQELGLTRIPHQVLLLMDVKGIKIGEIAFQVKIDMRIGTHKECIQFDVAPIGAHHMILVLLWLQTHNPEIHWSSGHIQFSSQYCNTHCLPQPHDVFTKQTPIQLNATDVSIPVVRCHPDACIPT